MIISLVTILPGFSAENAKHRLLPKAAQVLATLLQEPGGSREALLDTARMDQAVGEEVLTQTPRHGRISGAEGSDDVGPALIVGEQILGDAAAGGAAPPSRRRRTVGMSCSASCVTDTGGFHIPSD